MREKLLGAVIGLARATENNEDLITEKTDQLLTDALVASLPDSNYTDSALEDLYYNVMSEKWRIIPSCFTCASPCGRTDNYDMHDLSFMDWKRLEGIVQEEIRFGLLDAGISELQVDAYLKEAGEIRLTRTHGRREVAFLNRAWEDVLSADLLVDQSSFRQPLLNSAVNNRLCRCAGADGIATAHTHLEQYFRKR